MRDEQLERFKAIERAGIKADISLKKFSEATSIEESDEHWAQIVESIKEMRIALAMKGDPK